MLELKGISFVVSDEQRNCSREILHDINLFVEPNCFVVITGPNGSGKSTLAKIIMGMERPSSGSIFFDGQDITNLDVTERARLGIGFAFQQPVLFKGLRVRELLALAAGRELSTQEACDLLSAVGMCAGDYIDRELNSTLSGGEHKRIEIAMLIARQVKLSVFDEPEAGIDLWSFQSLIRVFKGIKAIGNSSAIIISHQERILDIADNVVVLDQGRISRVGPRERILPSLTAETGGCALPWREKCQ